MVERIRRNRREVSNTSQIESEMKLISELQERISADQQILKNTVLSLYDDMKAEGLSIHTVDSLVAEIFCPAGRATNTVSPEGFRKLVKDDKDFYSCVSVSITAAKKVLPDKQLATITAHTPAKLGEETVRVRQIGEK